MSQSGTFNNHIFPPGSGVQTITGNAGGNVGPDLFNNINVIGAGAIGVAGNPALNTLTISAVSATTLVVGVVRLATDAETIAGALSSVANTPASLKAKLGTQTLDTIPYGNGTGNAIQWTAAGTSGQILAGNTGAPPSWTTAGTTGELLVGNTAALPSWIAPGTHGQVLTGNTGVNPTFEAIGTLSGLTAHGVLLAEGNLPFTTTSVGNNGQVLQSKGVGVNPTWTSTTYPSTSVRGDTIYGSAVDTYVNLPFVATATRYLSNTGGGATIPAWSQVNLTNGVTGVLPPGSGGVLTWSTVGASGTLVVNTGIICTGGAGLSFALPAASAVGDICEIVLSGSTSWTITQGAGQQIFAGNTSTTLGAGGSLASTAAGDSLRMVCKTANTAWVVLSMVGNITVI